MKRKGSEFHYPHWLWLLPIILFSMMLITSHISTDAYWGDEAVSLRNIGAPPYPNRPLDEVIFHVGVSEWPPAYFLGLLGWGKIVGWSEFSTRIFSLFTSLLSIAFIYQLGRILFSRQIGIISALLLGTSVYFVFYSHELRGYALYILLTIMTLYFYWQMTRKEIMSVRLILAFVFSAIALIYTHYFAIIIFVSLGLYHVFMFRKIQSWHRIFFCFVMISIAYIPWLVIAILNLLGVATWKTGLSIQTILETILSSYHNSLWFIALPLMISAFLFYSRRATYFLGIIGFFFMILSLSIHQLSPFIFNVRHLIGFIPISTLLIAVGIASFPSHNALFRSIIMILWVVTGIWLNRNLDYMQSLPGTTRSVPIETLHIAKETITSCVQPEDTVLSYLTYGNSGWDENVIVYYLASPQQSYNLSMIRFMTPLNITHPEANLSPSYENRFKQLTTQSDRIWTFVAPFSKPTEEINEASKLLSAQYTYCGKIIEEAEVRGYLYQNTPEVTCSYTGIQQHTLQPCQKQISLLSDALMLR